jgi:hypothetical protein
MIAEELTWHSTEVSRCVGMSGYSDDLETERLAYFQHPKR